MVALNGDVAIAFNGEIYNFKDLRAQLELEGHSFRSGTDTEVILALYLKLGTDLLPKLNGIFAFAIWDQRSSTLFLARDSFGVKPLYFSEAGGAVSFASELKALLRLPWIPRDLDHRALANYVRYLWCPAPRTPVSHVRKLEQGEAMLVRDGSIEKRWHYAHLPHQVTDHSRSTDEWAYEIRDRLQNAVRRQMVADVPVGAFLSGGLDSSAIVAYARRFTDQRLQCFTIDFDIAHAREEGFVRDLPYAQRVAKHLDVDLHVVRVGSEMADALPQMVWQLDEPQADLSALNVLFISQLAREHGIKVLLSGAGGDDLFTGYRRHRALALEAWNPLPLGLRRICGRLGGHLPSRPPALRRLARLLRSSALAGNERVASYFDWIAPDDVTRLFAPEWRAHASHDPVLAELNKMPAEYSPLQRMLLVEQRFFLADHNLNYTDKMSMAAGVETRVPFLDPDVAELAARIPDRLRQRRGESKWILKKAMEGILPADVIYRPKVGFGVPLRAWMRKELRPLLYELLSPETVRQRGIFDSSVISKMVRDNELGRADHAYVLLSLMCIELWIRQFVEAGAERQ